MHHEPFTEANKQHLPKPGKLAAAKTKDSVIMDKKTYEITRENKHLIYVEVTGKIDLAFVQTLWTSLEEMEPPICILLRNTQDDIASLTTVNLLYKSAQDARIKAVAAFDLTSAQTLLVEWLLVYEGITNFRVFATEEAARAHLQTLCPD